VESNAAPFGGYIIDDAKKMTPQLHNFFKVEPKFEGSPNLASARCGQDVIPYEI
jgi:hypothetical protein